MPRVSLAQAKQNRINIEREAARLFREKGTAVSVTDVMAAVGLTHGGFYGHFASKDELINRACAVSFEQVMTMWHRLLDPVEDSQQAYATVINNYLSEGHRDSLSSPCPLATLSIDLARAEQASQHQLSSLGRTFAEGLETFIALMHATNHQTREQALFMVSSMVGALVIARASRGQAVSDEILQTVRRLLLE